MQQKWINFSHWVGGLKDRMKTVILPQNYSSKVWLSIRNITRDTAHICLTPTWGTNVTDSRKEGWKCEECINYKGVELCFIRNVEEKKACKEEDGVG